MPKKKLGFHQSYSSVPGVIWKQRSYGCDGNRTAPPPPMFLTELSQWTSPFTRIQTEVHGVYVRGFLFLWSIKSVDPCGVQMAFVFKCGACIPLGSNAAAVLQRERTACRCGSEVSSSGWAQEDHYVNCFHFTRLSTEHQTGNYVQSEGLQGVIHTFLQGPLFYNDVKDTPDLIMVKETGRGSYDAETIAALL
jgi:hypothetical protein